MMKNYSTLVMNRSTVIKSIDTSTENTIICSLTISIQYKMFLSALDSWSTNTVWASILLVFILLSFSCQKPRGALIPYKWKSKSGQWTTAAFRGIRSRNSIEFTRLAASPSRFRAGANSAFKMSSGIWWREERRSPARLSALRRRKVISRGVIIS